MEPIMMYERHTREGKEVFRMRIALPQWEGLGEMNDFYRALGERAADFCRDTLVARAERAYDEDGDPKKRFHFRPFRYTLTGTTHEESETHVRVRLCAELVTSNGERTAYEDDQFWEKAEQTLLKKLPKRPSP